jgi:IS5 family transposase
MLRIYFMQNWFNLSDPGAEDALYDSESMRRFAGIELAEDAIPDESTILRFRHLLERHGLTEQIFAEVRGLLEEKRLLLKSDTIVDATIIAAPPSTKNAEKARDPEMHQTRKGKEWHFGMKAHVGTDTRGIVHSVVTTPANEADINQLPQLLHGQEKVLFGDQANWSEFHRECAKQAGVRYRVNRRHLAKAADRVSKDHQLQPLEGPGAGKARISCGQAAVGIWQSPLSRPGEEHHPAVHRLCAGQPVSAQATVAASGGDVFLVSRWSRNQAHYLADTCLQVPSFCLFR